MHWSGWPKIPMRSWPSSAVLAILSSKALCCYECMGPAEGCRSRRCSRPSTLGFRAPSSRTQNMPFGYWSILLSGRCRQRSMTRRRQCKLLIRSRICCGGSGADNSAPAMPATRTAQSGSCSRSVPTWHDYLALSFDEIRQYGAASIQVGRRLRAALVGLSETIAVGDRRTAVQEYLDHLNLGIERSSFDDQDRAAALQEDRQGLGLSRRPPASESLPIEPQKVHSVLES